MTPPATIEQRRAPARARARPQPRPRRSLDHPLPRGAARRPRVARDPRGDRRRPGRDLRRHRQHRAARRPRPQRGRRAHRRAARRGVPAALPPRRARRRVSRRADDPRERRDRGRAGDRPDRPPARARPSARARLVAGAAGAAGNAIAARVRLGGGRRLDSPALIADGEHARSDAIVSIGVVLSAACVALGAPVADPIIGLAISALILRITWASWTTMRAGRHGHEHHDDRPAAT